jgi:hypothetical protein
LIQDASANNSFTIGGNEQVSGAPDGKVLHFADTSQYAYFAGDASGAYNQRNQKLLTEFRRELLFLKPNRVVVFDHLNAPNAKLVKRWHLNTLNEPTVGPASYEATAGGSKLFGESILPRGAAIVKQPLYYGSSGQVTSWRIDIAAPAGNPVDHFLNILETAPASQTAATPALPVRTSRVSLMGAQVGNQVVIFDASPGQPITYQANPVAGLEHFVLDQTPRKWYQIAARSEKGDVLQQQRAQVSDQGVLTFAVTAIGAHSITISPAGGPAGTAAVGHHADKLALKPRQQPHARRAGR